MRKTIITVAAAVAMAVGIGSPALAADGDPAGETLPICATDKYERSTHHTACVDRSGYGVTVIRADGTRTGAYGPSEYEYVAPEDSPYGVTSFRFNDDATPYGPSEHRPGTDY